MLPVDFEQSNQVFTKPKGWTDEECEDVSAWVGEIPGAPSTAIVMKYQLSKEDLEDINQTGVVWVMMIGGVVPHSLHTENPIP